jgi:large subunit ribosomal protein L25
MPDMIVTPREATGKEIAKKLRRAGKLPAVLYGEGKPSVSLTVDEKGLLEILKSKSGRRSIINFELEGSGQKRFVIVKDYQLNPLDGRLTHADFLRIDMAKTLRVKVPVHTTGEAAGVKQQGGVFELIAHEVEVECLPADIPEEIRIDISALMINQAIHYSDLKLGDKVKLTAHDLEQPLAHVTAPRAAEEEVAPAEGAEAAEPEVIAKGKKDEEGEEGAAAPADAKGAKPAAKDAKPAAKK